jgi:photosystem II stability/assembly factor-like uncharacterized protein
MQNVPKIVSERLRVAASAVGRADVKHPDANMLTAFAECSLSERERATVLDHLAGCHDCRDIVALALPVSKAAQPVFEPARPARTGWLTWPALRWGFIAAGIAAVASVGIFQYTHQSRQTVMVAKEFGGQTDGRSQVQASQNQTPPIQPQASAGSARADGAAPVASPSQPPEANQQNPRARIVRSFPPLPQIGARRGNDTEGSMTAVPAAKIPAASQTVEVSSAAVDVNQAASSQDDTVAQNLAPLAGQASAQLSQSEAVIRVKPAENATGAEQVPVNGRNFTQLATVAPDTSPSWAINSAGGLQRSFDQGSTWQDVNVNPNLVSSAAAYVAQNSQLMKESTEGKQAAKKTPAPAAAITFRSVVSTGSDVWAGGKSGALYHSLDAGDHWTKVVPSAAGISLTGDVTGMEFSDVQHGKIATSTSEVWITADDGQTWQKQ